MFPIQLEAGPAVVQQKNVEKQGFGIEKERRNCMVSIQLRSAASVVGKTWWLHRFSCNQKL